MAKNLTSDFLPIYNLSHSPFKVKKAAEFEELFNKWESNLLNGLHQHGYFMQSICDPEWWLNLSTLENHKFRPFPTVPYVLSDRDANTVLAAMKNIYNPTDADDIGNAMFVRFSPEYTEEDLVVEDGEWSEETRKYVNDNFSQENPTSTFIPRNEPMQYADFSKLLSNDKRLAYKKICWSLKDAKKAISDLLRISNAQVEAIAELNMEYDLVLKKLVARRFLHFTTNVACYSAFTALDYCNNEQEHVGLDKFEANIRFMDFPGKGNICNSESPGKEIQLAAGQISRSCVERVMKFSRMYPNDDADQIMEKVNDLSLDPKTPPVSDDEMDKE